VRRLVDWNKLLSRQNIVFIDLEVSSRRFESFNCISVAVKTVLELLLDFVAVDVLRHLVVDSCDVSHPENRAPAYCRVALIAMNTSHNVGRRPSSESGSVPATRDVMPTPLATLPCSSDDRELASQALFSHAG